MTNFLSTRTRKIIMALVVAALVGGGVTYWRVTADRLPDNAAFKIGDKVVTKDELNDRVEVLAALYGVQEPTSSTDKKAFRKAAAKSMAVSLLIQEEAEKRDIVISDKVAQDDLDKLIEAQLPEGRDGFEQFLRDSAISEKDVLEEIKRQLATSRLVEDVTEDVAQPDAEAVRNAYDDNKASMVTPEQRQLRNIVVASKSEAEQVLKAAKSGTSFTELVKTWSRDGSTRDSGGDLGVLTAAQLESDFAEAAFGVADGALFGPVQTRYGWNVGQVMRVIPSKPLAFETVKAQVKTELYNQLRLKKWSTFLRSVLREGDVTYASDYKPTDPYEVPSELPTQGAG
jgi:peptidyl-prolyl cis-trans isomerase C